VVLAEIDHLRLETRSILHALAHPGRKLGFVPLSAVGTVLDLSLVLGDFDPHRWQVKDLSALMIPGWDAFQVGLTVGAALDPMNLKVVWIGSHLQRMPFMTWLSTAFLAARLSQAAIAGLLEPITGRRFAAVAAVLGQLVFQRLYSLFETLNGFLLLSDHPCPIADQAHKQGDNGLFALASSGSNFFFSRKAWRLHGLILAEMHDFDNGKVQ
jgi:hypothetical protein